MQPKSILIVDDEFSVRTSLEKVLSRAGYLTRTAASGNEAIKKLKSNSTDVVVSDLKVPDGDGLDLLREVKSAYPYIEVVLLTGYDTIDTAVEAILRALHVCSADKGKAARLQGLSLSLLYRKMTNLSIDLND